MPRHRAPLIVVLVLTLVATGAQALPADGKEQSVYLGEREAAFDSRDRVNTGEERCVAVPGGNARCVGLGGSYVAVVARSGEQSFAWREPACDDDVTAAEPPESVPCDEPRAGAFVEVPVVDVAVHVGTPAIRGPAGETEIRRDPWIQSAAAGAFAALSFEDHITFVSIVLGLTLAALAGKLAYAGGVLPLYSKLTRESLLDDPNRAGLYLIIKGSPGTSIKEASERLGIGWGTCLHHLTKLEKRGFVVGRRFGKHKRYFVNGGTYSDHQQLAVAALKTPGTARVLRSLAAAPGLSQKELSAKLGVAPSTVLWHMRRLSEAGLVDRVRDGKEVRYRPAQAVPTRDGPAPVSTLLERFAVA